MAVAARQFSASATQQKSKVRIKNKYEAHLTLSVYLFTTLILFSRLP